MNLNEITQKGLSYYHANPAVTILIAVIVIFLLFKKPKLLFFLIFLGVAAIGVFYLISKLDSTGLEHRKIPFVE